MFDVGMVEMFVIVVLAIIVVGPKDLPKLLRSMGRFVAKIRAMGQEFQTTLKQMSDEIELEEVTRKLNEAGNIALNNPDTIPDIKGDISENISGNISGDHNAATTEDKAPVPKPDDEGRRADKE